MARSVYMKRDDDFSNFENCERAIKRVKYTTEEMLARIECLVEERAQFHEKRKKKQIAIYEKKGIKCILPETSEEIILKMELSRLRSAYGMRMRRIEQKKLI